MIDQISKEDKRQIQSIIRKGILRRCEEWMKETAAFGGTHNFTLRTLAKISLVLGEDLIRV